MTVSPLRRLVVASTALSLGLLGTLVVASPAAAADVTVTNQADFELALAAANANPDDDIIRIELAGGPEVWNHANVYQVAQNLQIIGPGETELTLHSTVGEGLRITGMPGTPITVAVSGLTLTPLNLGYDVILANDAVLTLDDLTVNGPGLSGVSLLRGELVATNIAASNLQSVGISGTDLDVFDVRDVVASFNGARSISLETSEPGARIHLERVFGASAGVIGIMVDADGASTDVVFQTVEVTGTGDAGMYLALQGSDTTFDLDDLEARFSGATGILLLAGGTTGTLTDSIASNNDAAGFAFDAYGAGSIATSELLSTLNDVRGITTETSGSGYISITDSDVVDNGDVAPTFFGGGIYGNIDGTRGLLLDDVRISENRVDSGGGVGIEFLRGDATVEIRNSDIFENISEDSYSGGGITFDQIRDTAGVLIRDSVIRDNVAPSGATAGGIVIGVFDETIDGIDIVRTTVSGNEGETGGLSLYELVGIGAADPVLSIDSSTFSGNEGDISAIGINESFTNGSTAWVDIVDSTISGNESTAGSTVWFDGNGASLTRFLVRHSTIVENTVAGGSGGIELDSDAQLELDHSVLADNTGGDDLVVTSGDVEIDWSLLGTGDGTATAALAAGTDNLPLGTDPQLGPLALNGGTTRNHLPTTGSALINRGDPAIAGAPTSDQRSLSRIQDGRIDIGATEVQFLLAATGREVTPAPVGLACALLAAGVAMVGFTRRATRIA